MRDEDHKIGKELPDGRFYAGLSPRTGKPMYLTSAHLGSEEVKVAFGLTWPEAQAAMTNLAPHGWRLPMKGDVDGAVETDMNNLDHGGWRWADESDADPYRQRRLNAAFMRAGSSPLTLPEEARVLPLPDEVNPLPPVNGGPKPGGPS